MGESTSPSWWFGLLAIVLSIAALGVSVTSLYLVAPQQKTDTATITTTSTVTMTTTLTTSVWWHSTTTGPAPFITVLGSRGTCGVLEEPELSYVRINNYVLLIYREQASVPCYRHVITSTAILERYPPIINITLELERTSDICIECIGVIETILRVGPLEGPGAPNTFPDGTEIVVNGLTVVLSRLDRV